MEGDEMLTDLVGCSACGRNFRPDVLNKHEPICIKNSKKKRKVFESGKQRAEGSDIPINKVLKPGEIPKADPKLAIAEAKTKKWREKHNILVESLRAARNYAIAKSSGGPLPPPPPTLIDSSLVQCPFCQRRFNEESSKRHISFCKEQHAKIQPRSSYPQVKKTINKTPVLKVKPEPSTQRIPISSSNGSMRQKTTLQSSTPSHSTEEEYSLRTTKSNVPARSAIGRVQPSVSNVNKPRSGIVAPRVTSGGSSLPRGPISSKKSSIPAPKSTNGGFCHECGSPFPVASAKFCSECGVRRLAL